MAKNETRGEQERERGRGLSRSSSCECERRRHQHHHIVQSAERTQRIAHFFTIWIECIRAWSMEK